jgi:2-keto-4-pentenoate hydratase/2-oxohepta-3-ene-1,7-dioic acid hydratase in catechol pathway
MTSYRLLSFQSSDGPRAGVVVGDTIYDAALMTAKAPYASVLGILNDWATARPILEEAASTAQGKFGKRLGEVKLLAPILYPSAIYCAGASYSDHVANMARIQNIPNEPDPHELGLNPWHFIKAPRCAVATGDEVELTCAKLDWEAELGCVIGTKARRVSLDKALDHVAFYTIGNDLSARDLTARPHIAVQSPFKYDWIGQKVFDGACPMGPWLVPAEDVGDPQSLSIKLWVNDVLKQDSNTSRMIFTAAEQIAHLSSRITLYPGDVVLTGTPSGVGAERGEFLKRGDNVKITIERIGDLTTKIV